MLKSFSEPFVTISKKQKVQKRLTDKSKPKLSKLSTWLGRLIKKLAKLRLIILETIEISKAPNMEFII